MFYLEKRVHSRHYCCRLQLWPSSHFKGWQANDPRLRAQTEHLLFEQSIYCVMFTWAIISYSIEIPEVVFCWIEILYLKSKARDKEICYSDTRFKTRLYFSKRARKVNGLMGCVERKKCTGEFFIFSTCQLWHLLEWQFRSAIPVYANLIVVGSVWFWRRKSILWCSCSPRL